MLCIDMWIYVLEEKALLFGWNLHLQKTIWSISQSIQQNCKQVLFLSLRLSNPEVWNDPYMTQNKDEMSTLS